MTTTTKRVRADAQTRLAHFIASAVYEGVTRTLGVDGAAADHASGIRLKRILHKAVTRNATEGELRRDEAIDRVERHCDPAWLKAAYALVKRIAMRKPFFTTADIWEAGLTPPHEPRALGAVMVSCERDGIINATKEYRKTSRASRHAAPVLVWKSCLCGLKRAA